MRDISTFKLNFFGLGAIGLFLFAIFKLKTEGYIETEILEIIKSYYEFTIPLIFVVINLMKLFFCILYNVC